jgi:hypothetical protein
MPTSHSFEQPHDHVSAENKSTSPVIVRTSEQLGYVWESQYLPTHSRKMRQRGRTSAQAAVDVSSSLIEQVLQDFKCRVRESTQIGDVETTQILVDELDQVRCPRRQIAILTLLIYVQLDKAILAAEPSNRLLSIAIQELRRWCRECKILPRSCVLAHQVKMQEPNEPVSFSSLSDVFRGEYNGTTVAIKRIRLHMDDMAAVKKVCRALLCASQPTLRCPRSYSGGRSLRGSTFGIPTSSHSLAYRITLQCAWLAIGCPKDHCALFSNEILQEIVCRTWVHALSSIRHCPESYTDLRHCVGA